MQFQKLISFSPQQFQMEGAGFKSKLQKNLRETQTAWKKFLKSAIDALAPVIGMALAGKS